MFQTTNQMMSIFRCDPCVKFVHPQTPAMKDWHTYQDNSVQQCAKCAKCARAQFVTQLLKVAQLKQRIFPWIMVIIHGYVNVQQRVNLHFPWFSYCFPRVFLWLSVLNTYICDSSLCPVCSVLHKTMVAVTVSTPSQEQEEPAIVHLGSRYSMGIPGS